MIVDAIMFQRTVFSLLKSFEHHENEQKRNTRILQRGFWDPARIFGIFLEIWVRKMTELGPTLKEDINEIS